MQRSRGPWLRKSNNNENKIQVVNISKIEMTFVLKKSRNILTENYQYSCYDAEDYNVTMLKIGGP